MSPLRSDYQHFRAMPHEQAGEESWGLHPQTTTSFLKKARPKTSSKLRGFAPLTTTGEVEEENVRACSPIKGGGENDLPPNKKQTTHIQAFTLLEVILSLAILASLMSGVAMLLKNSSEIKAGVSEAGNVNHRLRVAMEKISRDLAHAFMVSKTDFDRRTKAIFRIERHDNSDRLFLTTVTHRPKKINSKESDMTYVIYEVRKDEEGQLPTHLFRGETARVPESFRDEVETVMLARAVKALKIIPWNGTKWSEDRWHSNRGEYRNKIPHMVRVELEAYESVELDGENVRWEEAAVVTLKTVVFNHFATNFAQVKSIGAPVQWY